MNLSSAALSGFRSRSARLFCFLAALALAGCVHPLQDDGSGPSAPRNGDLEVRVFQGGFGVDFYAKAAKEYERAHPGVKIDLEGDPRIWEQLRPRFVGGDPPGL